MELALSGSLLRTFSKSVTCLHKIGTYTWDPSYVTPCSNKTDVGTLHRLIYSHLPQ